MQFPITETEPSAMHVYRDRCSPIDTGVDCRGVEIHGEWHAIRSAVLDGRHPSGWEIPRDTRAGRQFRPDESVTTGDDSQRSAQKHDGHQRCEGDGDEYPSPSGGMFTRASRGDGSKSHDGDDLQTNTDVAGESDHGVHGYPRVGCR